MRALQRNVIRYQAAYPCYVGIERFVGMLRVRRAADVGKRWPAEFILIRADVFVAQKIVADRRALVRQKLLHLVGAELGDEAIAHSVGPQLVNGCVQVEFASGPKRRAGFGARDEDDNRTGADLLLAERRGHGALPRRPREGP